MDRRRVDWAAGQWTREPPATRLAGDDLVVGASEGSDFWRTTHYGFVHDDGHALLGEWPADAAVEVTFDTSMRGDLEVRFTRWALAPADADLHEDPPLG
jgi:uncharacterized protein